MSVIIHPNLFWPLNETVLFIIIRVLFTESLSSANSYRPSLFTPANIFTGLIATALSITKGALSVVSAPVMSL